MKFSIKLFNFNGVPVYFKFWFLLLFFVIPPIYVASLFISILLHELGHVWMAKRLGYQVDSVEVDLFIGSANMDMDSISDSDTIKISFAGPWVNFALFSISVFFVRINEFAFIMCITNLILFLSNMLPIFPLDGGRILRSFLVLKTGDRKKSITVSALISFILSLVILVYYIFNFSIFGLVFSLLFLIFSVNELGWMN